VAGSGYAFNQGEMQQAVNGFEQCADGARQTMVLLESELQSACQGQMAGLHKDAMDRLHAVVEAKLAGYQGRARLIRQPSAQGAAQFADQSIDLLYIDGDHTYQGVTADLKAWWDKVNHKSGLICGDDHSWLEVQEACEDFFKRKSLTYRILAKHGHEHTPIWFYDFSGKVK